jgi:ankyrin repeat protein
MLMSEARSFQAQQQAQQQAQALAQAQTELDPHPLHTAARAGDEAALRALLGGGGGGDVAQGQGQGHGRGKEAEQVQGRTATGQTALHYAARRGHQACVVLLLEARADVDAQEDGGWSPLMLAVKRGHTSVVEQLLHPGVGVGEGEGASAVADTELRSSTGLTALSMACVAGESDIALSLLRSGASARVQDSKGWTPLHICIKKDMEDVVRQLLLPRGGCCHRGADLDAQTTPESDTALHLASRHGRPHLIAPLLAGGASAWISNAAGQQPLHCLSHSGGGALKAVRALIGAGAPLRGAAAADVDAETPAHVAARAGHALVLRALLVSQHRCTRPVLTEICTYVTPVLFRDHVSAEGPRCSEKNSEDVKPRGAGWRRGGRPAQRPGRAPAAPGMPRGPPGRRARAAGGWRGASAVQRP